MKKKASLRETSTPVAQPRDVWRPRVHPDCGFNTNPFEDFDHRGSTTADRPMPIRDATKDTAPLQGSLDVSDDDSLDSASGR